MFRHARVTHILPKKRNKLNVNSTGKTIYHPDGDEKAPTSNSKRERKKSTTKPLSNPSILLADFALLRHRLLEGFQFQFHLNLQRKQRVSIGTYVYCLWIKVRRRTAFVVVAVVKDG